MDLAGQAQYGRICGVGGGQRGRGVKETRPGHHNINAGLSGGERVAEGHVGCPLLMARMNGAYLLAGIVNRVVKVVDLHTGQSEDRVDAMGEKALHECFAAGTFVFIGIHFPMCGPGLADISFGPDKRKNKCNNQAIAIPRSTPMQSKRSL